MSHPSTAGTSAIRASLRENPANRTRCRAKRLEQVTHGITEV